MSEIFAVMSRQVSQQIVHYSHQAPHSALGMRSPAEFYAEWLIKNKTRSVQI